MTSPAKAQPISGQEIFISFVEKLDRHTRAIEENTRLLRESAEIDSKLLSAVHTLCDRIGEPPENEEDYINLMHALSGVGDLLDESMELAYGGDRDDDGDGQAPPEGGPEPERKNEGGGGTDRDPPPKTSR